jgi:hypothetical protein
VTGTYENGKELSGFIEDGDILDQKATISFSKKTLFRGVSSFALFHRSGYCANIKCTRRFSSTVLFYRPWGMLFYYILETEIVSFTDIF